MQKWVRYPDPGEFRGEGKWILCRTSRVRDFDYSQQTGFLPAVWSHDETGRVDRWQILGEVLLDNRNGFAMRVAATSDQAIEYAKGQIDSLVEHIAKEAENA